jgi:hypothetical protein
VMQRTERTAREVILFYPGSSLARQIVGWGRGRADCAVEPVFARSISGMRRAIRSADLVLVDATRDYPQAMDVFSQALAYLGAGATAVYTERMHEGLELFVRLHGSLLLLGPLGSAEWEGFFERAIRTSPRKREWGRVA